MGMIPTRMNGVNQHRCRYGKIEIGNRICPSTDITEVRDTDIRLRNRILRTAPCQQPWILVIHRAVYLLGDLNLLNKQTQTAYWPKRSRETLARFNAKRVWGIQVGRGVLRLIFGSVCIDI